MIDTFGHTIHGTGILATGMVHFLMVNVGIVNIPIPWILWDRIKRVHFFTRGFFTVVFFFGKTRKRWASDSCAHRSFGDHGGGDVIQRGKWLKTP